MEKHRLRMFENRVLRRIFGPKRDEIIGDWRLRNEKLHDLPQTTYCHQIKVRWADGSWVLRGGAKPGLTESRLHGWSYGGRWDRILAVASVLLARRHVLYLRSASLASYPPDIALNQTRTNISKASDLRVSQRWYEDSSSLRCNIV
jgi:hypothetical protein